MFQILTSALIGPAQARAAHRQALKKNPGISLGMEQLQALCPSEVSDDKEEPIFLLSAGWRSGSTLLQRLIMSDSNVLMWGEPYDECGIIQALAGSMKAFRPEWPPQDYYYNGTPPGQLSGEWIANLFPTIADFRKGQRSLFDAMFAEPAKKAGAARWGLKEVRLGSEHCSYLHWLYPKAKFVLLYRDPLEAYRSYCRYGCSWYDTFPDKPVFTPTAFGKHWKKLADGFMKDAKYLGALVIKYEDLLNGRTSPAVLENYLNIKIDHSLLQIKVGSSERHDGKKSEVNQLQKWLLKRAVNPVAEQLGYNW